MLEMLEMLEIPYIKGENADFTMYDWPREQSFYAEGKAPFRIYLILIEFCNWTRIPN